MVYIARLNFKLLFCVHSSKFGKCLLANSNDKLEANLNMKVSGFFYSPCSYASGFNLMYNFKILIRDCYTKFYREGIVL